jgi:hypothetical protein
VVAATLLSALLALWGAAPAFAEESNDGLPPGVPLPSWAVGKQIHFDPTRPAGGPAEPGMAEPLAETSLLYFNGPVEVEPSLFLIFWGKKWKEEPGQGLKTQLLKMYEGLGGSTYQKILTQYDSPGGHVASSPNIESIVEENEPAPAGVEYTAILEEAEKERKLAGSKENLDDQYVVLTAPGSTYAEGFGSGFCAYHESMGKYGSLAFVAYGGDPPFSEGSLPCTFYGAYEQKEEEEPSKYNANYAMSGAASHEYSESVTDPEPRNGWMRSQEPQQEIADICQSHGKHQMPNGAWVTELWDNTKGGCEIADESPTLQQIGPYIAPEYEATLYVTPTSAQLDGGMEPCGLEAHYLAEYGTTTSYGSKSEGTLASGYWGPVQEPIEVSGLKPKTTYDWRFVAKTSGPIGTVDGANHEFTTSYSPAVHTEAATGVHTTEATLNGTVNPEGYETKTDFQYATTEEYDKKGEYGKSTSEVSVGSGTTTLEESATVSLTPGTTYHFRIVASNAGGTSYGADEQFTTPPTSKKPFVETKAATGVGETTATLHGIVNPENAETKYYFEYGTTESYGSKTAEASAGSGTTNVEESKALTGLAGRTTYHFRIVATNSNGTSDGTDHVFLTLGKPSVETKAATNTTATGATLHGTVNPWGAETKYYFEYGLTTSYGSKTAEASAGSGITNVEESKTISGLAAGTTYHFRIVAANTHGTTDGGDKTFGTSPVWYVKKGGVFKAVSETVNVTFENDFELIDTKYKPLGEPLAISCKGEGTGEIKSAGESAIDSFSVGQTSNCKGIEGKYPLCEKLTSGYTVDLPWAAELYREGGEDRDKILSPGHEEPSFLFSCSTFIGEVSDTCEINTSTHISNNASGGFVEAAFDSKSNKTKCSLSSREGEGGEWKGVLKIRSTSKEVEAIKVE